MASSFVPSAAPSAERAPAARQWREEVRLSPQHGAGAHRYQDSRPQGRDSGEEAVELGSLAERQAMSPADTEATSLSHSNAEISLHPGETSSESGSDAASESEDSQRRDRDAAEDVKQRLASRDDSTEATGQPQMVQPVAMERGHGRQEIVPAEPRAQAIERSPRRLSSGRNNENAPAQGSCWLRTGGRRGDGKGNAVSAAQKLDFEAARPSPVAPLGKAAAANWLRSRR